MAITYVQLQTALRMGATQDEASEAQRLLGVAQALVATYLKGAACPEPITDEAAILTAGYLYDQPTASRTNSFANALRNSGAVSMLAPHRVQRPGASRAANGQPY